MCSEIHVHSTLDNRMRHKDVAVSSCLTQDKVLDLHFTPAIIPRRYLVLTERWLTETTRKHARLKIFNSVSDFIVAVQEQESRYCNEDHWNTPLATCFC
jgi:hypothetical protein